MGCGGLVVPLLIGGQRAGVWWRAAHPDQDVSDDLCLRAVCPDQTVSCVSCSLVGCGGLVVLLSIWYRASHSPLTLCNLALLYTLAFIFCLGSGLASGLSSTNSNASTSEK